jgi:carbonic anhydrase/acetyltransferase-like protein (isoleucine patch superfamily)
VLGWLVYPEALAALSWRCGEPTKSRGETLIRSFRSRWPQIAASAYIDPASTVIGDVTIGERSSVWPGVVIRGDVHWIRIGSRTNIQDGTIIHVMGGQYSTTLGDGVTVGHGAILHGCTIESNVLVGMGAILLNGVVVGSGSIIAAGTLVPERTVIPAGSLFMGHPGKLRRALTPEDIAGIADYATRYVELAETYRHEPLAAGKGPSEIGSGHAAKS